MSSSIGGKMTETTESKTKNPEFDEAREHFKAAHQAMRDSMKSLIPPGYLENRRAARREVLLGLRKLLDVAIDHMDKKHPA
jgi:hypothetical protein